MIVIEAIIGEDEHPFAPLGSWKNDWTHETTELATESARAVEAIACWFRVRKRVTIPAKSDLVALYETVGRMVHSELANDNRRKLWSRTVGERPSTWTTQNYLTHADVGYAIINSLEEAGALKLMNHTGLRTGERSTYWGVYAPGLDAWEAARRIALSRDVV